MPPTLLALAILLSILAGCRGDRPAEVILTIPPDKEARSYTLIDSLSDLPVPVLEAMLHLCNGCEIADIGDNFRSTDIVITGSLPTRRLVRAGRSGSTWFVHYEHGGIGYHEHSAIFEVNGESVVFSGGSIFNTENGVISHIYSSCSPAQTDCEW